MNDDWDRGRRHHVAHLSGFINHDVMIMCNSNPTHTRCFLCSTVGPQNMIGGNGLASLGFGSVMCVQQ